MALNAHTVGNVVAQDGTDEDDENTGDDDDYTSSSTDGGYQLPKDIIPVRYHLFLWPDMRHAVFLGHVSIEVQIKRACRTFLLNALGLSIFDVKFCIGMELSFIGSLFRRHGNTHCKVGPSKVDERVALS